MTGPTGSGKSTSLYAALGLVNTPEKNIITIEDPVEYQVPGITQVQVNPKAGFSGIQLPNCDNNHTALFVQDDWKFSVQT